MDINDGMSCCAIAEIGSLKEYVGKPEEAMKAFCRWVKGYGGVLNPDAFYIFSEITSCVAEDGECNGECAEGVGYGAEFAAYIKKHKLGVLRQSPTRKNRVNEPCHLDTVWIWAPSLTNLTSWWKEHGK